jgi:formylglycine-generating enzyme required for sulfatase activity
MRLETATRPSVIGRTSILTHAVAGGLLLGSVSCADAPPRLVDPVSGVEFVLIEPGEFTMGSPASETGREAQERPHRVRLTRAFYLGATEVTQAQWQNVMGTTPSHFAGCGPSCPVERVNVHDIQTFLARLNGRGAGTFRLPTEAEWEYACRAGGSQPFGDRSTVGENDANIDGRFPYGASASVESVGTTPVRSYAPNAWGLFDMAGNVWEWTQDAHCAYPDASVVDPVGRCDSPHRVIRGGSWKFDGNSARCALRYTHRPEDRGFSLGFRLVRDVG